MNARIKKRDLEFLKLARIPVIDPINEGLETTIEYPIVNGVMLVPLKDAHVFNLSSSTLRKKIKAGELTAYEQDGTIRAANARTDIFWCPYQYFKND